MLWSFKAPSQESRVCGPVINAIGGSKGFFCQPIAFVINTGGVRGSFVLRRTRFFPFERRPVRTAIWFHPPGSRFPSTWRDGTYPIPLQFGEGSVVRIKATSRGRSNANI